MRILIRIYILLIFLFTFFSCGEEEVRNTSFAPMLIKVNLNSGRDGALNSPGGYVIYTPASPHAGNEIINLPGILAFRTSIMGNSGKYGLIAYDLRCPNENDVNILITPSGAELTATCNGCKSVYNLMDGSVKSGTSKKNLMHYSVQEGNVFGEDFIIHN